MIVLNSALLSNLTSIFFDNTTITVINEFKADAQAVIYLEDKNETDNLYIFQVNTSANSSDYQQAYAAGYGEGLVTSKLIAFQYRNTLKAKAQNCTVDSENQTICDWNDTFREYARKQLKYIIQMVKDDENSTYWRGMHLLVTIIQGMQAGYMATNPEMPLTFEDFYMIQAQNDFSELTHLYNKTQYFENEKSHLYHSCTGLLKMATDCRDIFFGHNTWTRYQAGFMRLAKTYIFHFSAVGGSNEQKMQVAGHAGIIFSKDDYYITNTIFSDGYQSKLGVLETTISIKNDSLFDLIDKNGRNTFSWMRMVWANLVARNAAEWDQIFAYNQSYTYNNEYVILDYKIFEDALKACQKCSVSELKEHLLKPEYQAILHVYVSYPGKWMGYNATDSLVNDGYYYSINIPLNESMADYANISEKDRVKASTRYCLSVKYMPQIETMEEFKAFLRSNDYQHENCTNDPGLQIAARYDLRPPEKVVLHGAADGKVTSLKHFQNFSYEFIVGPVFGGPSNIPKFDFKNFRHLIPQPEGVHEVLPVTGWHMIGLQVQNVNTTSTPVLGIVFGVLGGLVLVAGVAFLVFYIKKAKSGYQQVQEV